MHPGKTTLLILATGVLSGSSAVGTSPVVQDFDRYWSGSSPALPWDDTRAADYDPASKTIWAVQRYHIARLDVEDSSVAIVANVPEVGMEYPRSLYYDPSLDRVVMTWEEEVAVVNPETGDYQITHMPSLNGGEDWYDYDTHTLFMTFAASGHGLQAYNVASGDIAAPVITAGAKRITGSSTYLLVHDMVSVSLWDHELNLVRRFTDDVFPDFDVSGSAGHWLSMTNDQFFAYGNINQWPEHQYYVGRLDPDAILYDVNDETYPLDLPSNAQMQRCYYSDVENVLYATVSSIASAGLLQIDLDSHEVARYGRPGQYVRDVLRRGDKIFCYGEDGVFVSAQSIPEPATSSLLFGALVVLGRRWKIDV